MAAAWFLLPPRAHAFMFSLNGPLAFPIILASWMLADTPATNVMGSNPALALSVLEDQAAYWRWLAARCIVIGSLVGVACAAGVMYVGCRPLSLERDPVGLRARRLSAGRSSPGCCLARHPVPLPPALAPLALAAPPSLAQPPAVGGACLRALLLRAIDRRRHPEPGCGARPIHQGAWPAAHAGPVRHLSGCRLRNSRRRCRHRSLGRTSAPSLADHPPGRLPREHRQGLTRSASCSRPGTAMCAPASAVDSTRSDRSTSARVA